jgi:uncharacterized protein (DUF1778 family)
MRVPQSALDLVDRVAASVHQDRTTFMLDAALAKANEILRDRTVFQLSDADYERFVAALDDPAPPTEAMKALLHREPLWERERD